jgi:H+-transporting ATPase
LIHSYIHTPILTQIIMPDLEEGGRLTETAAIGGGTHPTTSTIPQQPTEGEYDWVPTDPTTGLTSEQVAQALARYGPNEIPVPDTPLYLLFVRQFVGFLPFLIELAAIVSLAVQDYIDFGIILGILLVNGCLGFREEYHAKKSLQAVSASLDSEIAVRRDGLTTSLLVKQLVPGDIVFLVGGTIVPADVLWISGDVVQLDTAALTGEPLPRKYPSAEHGRTLLSGTTVTAGECYGQVLRIGTATEIGQAQVDILQDKSVRIVSVFQQKIMKVVQILIAGSLIVVLAVLLVKGIVYDGFDDNVKETILDALSILIASIPVALPLVVQVNLALGASFLAKEHHAIVTSIPALQDIASMSMLCSDKTGTLTTANMSVIPEQVFAAEGFTTEQVLLYAYLCSNPDKKDDPIDRAVVAAFLQSAKANEKDDYVQTEIIGFNPTVKRVVAFVGHGNETITIAKGLPAKIVNTQAGGEDDHELQWQVNRAADRDFLDRVGSVDTGLSKAGYKTIGIGVCFGNARTMKNPVWKFAGLVPMLDPPREDTRATIESLHHANISIKMITGDHQNGMYLFRKDRYASSSPSGFLF